MGRRTYSDADRALVYAELAVNEGNVKRTARNLGVPVPTVRRWRDEWERNGVPETISAEIAVVASDFLTEARRVRDKLLARLEHLVDAESVGAREVVTAFGILSDKIRAYEALEQTQKVEHTIQLPSAEEMKELFQGMVSGVVSAAQDRAAAIEAVQEPVTTTFVELPAVSD